MANASKFHEEFEKTQDRMLLESVEKTGLTIATSISNSCNDYHRGFSCTRPKNHDGLHAAHGRIGVVEIWN